MGKRELHRALTIDPAGQVGALPGSRERSRQLRRV